MYVSSLETVTDTEKKFEFVRLDRASYDELTHRMRHLQTLARSVLLRTERLERIISDLTMELSEKRKEFFVKVESLDNVLTKLKGEPICKECSRNGGNHVSDTDTRDNKT